MPHGGRWTDAELLALWRGWPDTDAIALKVGRTREAVYERGRVEGLRLPEGRVKVVRAWTGAKVKRLRELWGTMPNSEVAEALGVTLRAVENKAVRVGVTDPAKSDRLALSPHRVVNEIRRRAREDGISMKALDREAGTGRYFTNDCRKAKDPVNLRAVVKALAFLGGELTVHWTDE